MSELIAVSKEQFIEHMSQLNKTTRIGKRLTDFADGSHGVQYPDDAGTVLGEVFHSREFGTIWRIKR
ncbi:hypothetical protein PP187_gp263 [Klebsiella phage vB_KvM-Eowyn]|uniref:Uncharacterized protein n=1 Tax=Klebsiella phage vB_KvM-Eowyn TaxID=2762819 RepID=A0A7R8MJT4_9CAUD|nr:hypothetical protein PP187_gp263 [Klebsiella phage vB_KvM-Eowyn]CAD5236252.1 hypothetical protein LLCLJKAH_00263 [Klebsiella phage vB_KvM-Eowyn]